MQIKIKRVFIQNFKLFKVFRADFTGTNFLVFDGPNGFGKTSFFDALELLFTGRIRRYDELARLATDGRESFGVNPYLNSQNKEGDLIIKIELEVNGETKILMRKAPRERLKTKTRISELEIEIYELPNFEESEGRLIQNEKDYLTSLLGKNYREDFRFLHYIEQEENLALLKSKDKDRKDAIDYLFNTVDFQSKLEKIKNASTQISELCGTVAKRELERIEQEIQQQEKNFSREVEAVAYTKLITWDSESWDQEEIQFKEGQYSYLLGTDGLLEKLKVFITNFSEFKKKRANIVFENILSKRERLKQIIEYFNFLDKAPVYTEKLLIQKEIQRIKDEYKKGILQAVLDKKIQLTFLEKLVPSNISIKEYIELQNEIIKFKTQANAFAGAVASLQAARKAFVGAFNTYIQTSRESKECPMCGFEWESFDALQLNLRKKEGELQELFNSADSEMSVLLNKFEADFVVPIQSAFDNYLKENSVDEKFVKELERISRFKDELQALYLEIESKGIGLKDLINDARQTADEKMILLQKEIEAKKMPVISEKLKDYFSDIFVKHFKSNEKFIDQMSLESIENKRRYIDWKYSLYQNEVLKLKRKDLEEKNKRFNNASKIKEQLNQLKKIYDNSLKDYQKKIIGDIEILFHIYSGRIIQDSQEGMGLFIYDKSGIRFLEDPERSHDAIFTMSSGQLAVLVIAFTLTLNRKYSQNKILFIDDPIQTLDELNVSSLVELLRSEFADRQIYLSTHEDKMSAFMRYKFEKQKLKTAQFSFRDAYFDVQKDSN